MTQIWGRNSFVGITKDFLMTMKTCKSGNSTKMFCPQMEGICPQIMLFCKHLKSICTWKVDMLACPFVYICGRWGFIRDNEKFYLICKPGASTESHIIGSNRSQCSECFDWLFVAVYLEWYLVFGLVYLSKMVKSFYWICKAGEAGLAAIEFWWQSNNNFFLVHLNFPRQFIKQNATKYGCSTVG